MKRQAVATDGLSFSAAKAANKSCFLPGRQYWNRTNNLNQFLNQLASLEYLTARTPNRFHVSVKLKQALSLWKVPVRSERNAERLAKVSEQPVIRLSTGLAAARRTRTRWSQNLEGNGAARTDAGFRQVQIHLLCGFCVSAEMRND